MFMSWIPDAPSASIHFRPGLVSVPFANSGGYQNHISFVNQILLEEEVCSQAVGTGRLSSRLSRESVVAPSSSERFACFSLMFKKLYGNHVLQVFFCVLDTIRLITGRKPQMDCVSKAFTFQWQEKILFFRWVTDLGLASGLRSVFKVSASGKTGLDRKCTSFCLFVCLHEQH